MQKKLFFITLVLVFIFPLSGCGVNMQTDEQTPAYPQSSTPSFPSDVKLDTNTNSVYRVSFPADFTSTETSPMKEDYTSWDLGLSYPKSYFIRSISEAYVDMGTGDILCSGSLRDGNRLTKEAQKISQSGVVLDIYTWSEAGAGNIYQGRVATVKKDNVCYAVSLFLHTTQPENYGTHEAEFKQYRLEHEAAQKKIFETFDSIIQTFEFVQE